MSAATNAFENSVCLLLFNNTNIANIGDATGLRGSSAAGVLYISLHTGSPGETGTQTTSETGYTSYAREDVARASGAGGWTVTNDVADNTSAITFAASTGAADTVTHFGIGTDASGTGTLILYGANAGSIVMNSGVIFEYAAGALDVSVS